MDVMTERITYQQAQAWVKWVRAYDSITHRGLQRVTETARQIDGAATRGYDLTQCPSCGGPAKVTSVFKRNHPWGEDRYFTEYQIGAECLYCTWNKYGIPVTDPYWRDKATL